MTPVGQFESLDAPICRIGAARHVSLDRHAIDDLKRSGRAHAELRRQLTQVASPTPRSSTYPGRGARENAVWDVTVEPGVAGSPHYLTHEETFVALDGSALVEVDGQRHELGAGNVFVVGAGQTLALPNTGSQPFRALAVFPVEGQAAIGDKAAFTPAWAA